MYVSPTLRKFLEKTAVSRVMDPSDILEKPVQKQVDESPLLVLTRSGSYSMNFQKSTLVWAELGDFSYISTHQSGDRLYYTYQDPEMYVKGGDFCEVRVLLNTVNSGRTNTRPSEVEQDSLKALLPFAVTGKIFRFNFLENVSNKYYFRGGRLIEFFLSSIEGDTLVCNEKHSVKVPEGKTISFEIAITDGEQFWKKLKREVKKCLKS